jgi:carbonic anhydrase
MRQEEGSGISAAEALARLMDGNTRFVSGVAFYPPIGGDRRAEVVAHGQQPYATIVGCSDSRVPLEVLFNQGIGDIFVVRVAGNVCATDETGSVEYGVDHLGTPLCVVLGHSHCGAVTAVLTGAEVHGSIPKLIEPIIPAVEQVKRENPGVPPGELVPQAVVANVWQAIADLLSRSEAVRRRIAAGRLQVLGAVYDLPSGQVEWLGEHPRQAELLAGAMQAGE